MDNINPFYTDQWGITLGDLRAITGKLETALMLNGIVYWYFKARERPFYKFQVPCNHPYYNEGDSWLEYTGLNKRQIGNALKAIATKVKYHPDFFQEIMINRNPTAKLNYLVFYWTKQDHRTYYVPNMPLIHHISELYVMDIKPTKHKIESKVKVNPELETSETIRSDILKDKKGVIPIVKDVIFDGLPIITDSKNKDDKGHKVEVNNDIYWQTEF